ncbi:3-oxo-5-alpha-steroid 4-dehydrogenase 2a [Clupea harengus]|uniref:3-oxo-5-alpha-steroid 4-dehydrogenase n=1 Tax=Clupea harengus TaxID=7950 RepID=A0A6P3WAB5_CLUHA|nr:3-oxo-5-alpha-steroid 4-dehydrogenase 2a [Clupea harengus]
MQCLESTLFWISWAFTATGLAFVFADRRISGPYGRYVPTDYNRRMVPAALGWFIQELPAFLVPVLLALTTEGRPGLGKVLLLCTYCLHYFQRTFVFSLLTRGKPMPAQTVRSAAVFCTLCGAIQSHNLLHCAHYDHTWLMDGRLVTGLFMFFLGMAINIHSDHVLRSLRKPGETAYKIPRGGMFEYVSGANYFGEIMEWYGFAMATWSLPALSFAFFTMCSIGPRAYYHHRFYIEKFSEYPKTRKALIPFIF